MPFTLSHPAAVLPLRRFGVFSALIIGSMMPDTMYFLPWIHHHDRYGHTLPGLFLYCLPVAMLFLWLFHHFAKRPLIALFPSRHQPPLLAASPEFHFAPVSRFVGIAFSILIGAATHDLWDGFTHTETFLFTTGDWLSQPVNAPGPKLQVADVLQLGSSVLGLLIIAFCYYRWLKRAAPSDGPSRVSHAARVMFVLLAVSSVIPFFARLILDPDLWFHVKRRSLISGGVVSGIKLMSAELFVFCVIWHLVMRRRSHVTSPVSHSY